MLSLNNKEVRFDIWCKDCIHFKRAEHEFPCDECLNTGYNIDSTKPTMFIKDEHKNVINKRRKRHE